MKLYFRPFGSGGRHSEFRSLDSQYWYALRLPLSSFENKFLSIRVQVNRKQAGSKW
jgi:hypothetical protein